MTARPGSGAPAAPAARVTAARRIPDLSALPPLLRETTAFAKLAASLAGAPGGRGRHAAVTAVPHGAKSFLAAALALAPQASGSAGSPATPRSATGSPRS